jgi:hypothetical protein
MRNYTFRLKAGQDLFDSISLFVREHLVQSGCVLSGVGSLTHVTLRRRMESLPADFSILAEKSIPTLQITFLIGNAVVCER